ncbi:MAG: hypothetical protein J4A00_02640 [Gammaproteobacteria bacterium]|nr:hypothetical protein [Gammaproteobacteria bacterium]
MPDQPDQGDTDTRQPLLGESSALITLDDRVGLSATSIALVGQARRSINIYTPDLEPWLYDNGDLIAGVRQLVVAHGRHARVRILLLDAALARQGHGLIRLAQQLPTFISVHRLLPGVSRPESAFMTVDGAGYIFRAQSDRYTGMANFCDRFRVRELNDRFQQLWDQSEPEPECRRQPL